MRHPLTLATTPHKESTNHTFNAYNIYAQQPLQIHQYDGAISRKIIDLELEGVVIKGVPAEVCDKCGEKYFDTKTATFVQEITGFIKNKRIELALPAR